MEAYLGRVNPNVMERQVSKKLVNSDFKNNRVEDPTRISSKQEKNVKKYVKDYFDKAVAKKREHDKKKAERKAKPGGSRESPAAVAETPVKKEDESDGEEVMVMSEDEDVKDEDVKEGPKSITPMTPIDQTINGDGLKRKREREHGLNGVKIEDEEATPSKRPRSLTPPAPPPPPPPAEGMPEDDSTMDDSGEYNGETPQDFPYEVYSQGTINDVTAMVEEQMDAVDPPPPPPPLPIESPVNETSYGTDHQETGKIIDHFEFSKTPDDHEEMSDKQDDGFVTIHHDQSRYLEAQGGA